MTSRTTELDRLRSKVAMRRFRKRQAGMLPPLQKCDCGQRINGDRWGRLCSTCAKARGFYNWRTKRKPTTTPRAVRLAAEALIQELRAEARAGV